MKVIQRGHITGNEAVFKRARRFNTKLVNNDRVAKGYAPHAATWTINMELWLKSIARHWCWRHTCQE